jgi:3',5'-cyclic AMP phosphodiesterase CpdA
MRIVQISDTHLSHRRGVTEEHLLRTAEFVNGVLRPDLVVHTGDVVVLDPDDRDDRVRAHELVSTAFTAPVRVLPGNHDVGDGGPAPWRGIAVTEERVAAYEEVWGPDRWREDHEGWTLLGLDSEVLGTGLLREDAQWVWLEETVTGLDTDRPVLLFLHKPVFAALDRPTDHAVDVGPRARERLLTLFAGTGLRAVGSGHLHRYRSVDRDGVREVWAPSTAFVAGEGGGLPAGLAQLGVVTYDTGVDAAGASRVSVAFRAPGDLETVAFDDVPAVHETLREMDERAVAGAR